MTGIFLKLSFSSLFRGWSSVFQLVSTFAGQEVKPNKDVISEDAHRKRVQGSVD